LAACTESLQLAIFVRVTESKTSLFSAKGAVLY
jgi:hypothetical protein